ncbi:transcriptional regulator [Virgibacillus profundi]|uniref:Transcriptional regulator n=1 Tax=Virgibacillus profundi TaxID=2024555 RepID=A0A2A2IK67_9BACI|nr:helix-turn-helix transcriptional regulator [Virgibacillus profundi]PAV31550.1 transcriptional regulator [Virgibacillus profundi]PXY55736.1 XRE family transcriptional regulator [Virgibacillus profundi]
MIGKNIQTIRKRKGLTLSECAERANISKSYLSNIERSKNQNPSIQIIEKIANVLEVDLRSIVGIKPGGQQMLESEWMDFVKDLKKSGVEKGQLQEYKTVIEFARWQKEKNDSS